MENHMTNMLKQCPICLEDYKIPRALPCLHTFCETCLVDYVKQKSSNAGFRVSEFGTFVCPVCKEDATLPPHGVKGFKFNFYIASLVGVELPSLSPSKETAESNTYLNKGIAENTFSPNKYIAECTVSPNKDIAGKTIFPNKDIMESTISTNKDITQDIACQRCEEQGVSKICLKCSHWLCSFCCDDHGRVKVTRDHILLSFSELVDDVDAGVPVSLQNTDLSKCAKSEHSSSAQKLFCVSCKMLICEHCHTENHGSQTHDVLSVITNMNKTRDNLVDCLSNVQERRLMYKSQHYDLTRYKKDMNRRYHLAQKTIFKNVDMLQKRILDFKTHINRKLKENIDSQAHFIDNYICETNEKIAMADSLQDDINYLLNTNNRRKILTQADDFIEQGNKYISDETLFGKLTIR